MESHNRSTLPSSLSGAADWPPPRRTSCSLSVNSAQKPSAARKNVPLTFSSARTSVTMNFLERKLWVRRCLVGDFAIASRGMSAKAFARVCGVTCQCTWPSCLPRRQSPEWRTVKEPVSVPHVKEDNSGGTPWKRFAKGLMNLPKLGLHELVAPRLVGSWKPVDDSFDDCPCISPVVEPFVAPSATIARSSPCLPVIPAWSRLSSVRVPFWLNHRALIFIVRGHPHNGLSRQTCPGRFLHDRRARGYCHRENRRSHLDRGAHETVRR